MTSLQHPPTDTTTPTPTTTGTDTPSAIQTHHCRFCNHLLLATTRHLPSLPRRKEPARDAALILPLPVSNTDDEGEEQEEQEEEEEEEEEGNGTTTQTQTQTPAQKQHKTKRKGKDYSILLSTTLPDRKPTLIRREDGFEKRLLLRCGRCRVGMGYFLDPVHFPDNNGGEDWDGDAKVVYLLPGALMETGVMVQGDEGKMKAMDQEWTGWT